MTKNFYAPNKYIQGVGILKELKKYSNKKAGDKTYILIDRFIAEKYQDVIVSSYQEGECALVAFNGECSKEETQRHVNNIKNNSGFTAIMGIGGGKTIDAAKATAHELKMPIYIVPTAASTDAPCSALSVLYHNDGTFDEYLFLDANPDAVLVDEEIIAQAPVRLFVAGIGDALATYYEADASRRSNAQTVAGGTQGLSAMALAKLCHETLLKDGFQAVKAVENKAVTKAVSNIIEANTLLSGLGFESGGLAGAHAIHNGMTVIEELHSLLHGEKVAFGTLTQMVLENRPMDEILEIMNFCKNIGLPTNFVELGIPNISDEKLLEAAALANSENDTMANLGFKVSNAEIVGAMKTLHSISISYYG